LRKGARFFKSLADETRLQILWLWSGTEELWVCDGIDVLGITQSQASRHRRYLHHLGRGPDRREGLWMNYRLSLTPGSPGEKLVKLLEERLAPQPEAQALRNHPARCLEAKRHSLCAKRLKSSQKRSRQGFPET
jgi:ArsR family transcriptional regulator